MSALPAYVTHADCAKHEMGIGHPECPERLSSIHRGLRANGLLDRMRSYEAPLAAPEHIARVHDREYIDTLEAQRPMHGYAMLDADTAMNVHTWTAALRAAGAAILATDLVLNGDAPTAFCNVRPPGHHAERDRAMGFCFFNNVAIGIRHALEAHGVERVALIDFDVHHGNGSEDALFDESRVLMCSIFEHPLYPHSGDRPRGPNMINVPMRAGAGGSMLRDIVNDRWCPALDAFRPQLLFISAGFDAHREDHLAHLAFDETDYAWLTDRLVEVARAHARGRIVSMLEGGYALAALERSAVAHVRGLVESSGPRDDERRLRA